MSVGILRREVQVPVLSFVDLVRYLDSLFCQIQTQRFQIGRLKCYVRKAVVLFRGQAGKDLNVLPVADFEVDESGRSILLIETEGVVVPEQAAIEYLSFREVAHLKRDMRNTHQRWTICCTGQYGSRDNQPNRLSNAEESFCALCHVHLFEWELNRRLRVETIARPLYTVEPLLEASCGIDGFVAVSMLL